MQIGSDAWIAKLIEGAGRLGHRLEAQQAHMMARHAQLLGEWNRRINLTAISDPLEVAVKHCLDAIAPLHLLPPDGKLLDIGTGGGFPGIPLKIMRPDLDMTLIDAVRKKISFVNHVIRCLGLSRIEALHVRAEALAGEQRFQGRYTVIVCRALADLTKVARLALPLLSGQGKIVVYQGPRDRSALGLDGSGPGHHFLPAETVFYQLPFLGDKRQVAVLQRSGR